MKWHNVAIHIYKCFENKLYLSNSTEHLISFHYWVNVLTAFTNVAPASPIKAWVFFIGVCRTETNGQIHKVTPMNVTTSPKNKWTLWIFFLKFEFSAYSLLYHDCIRLYHFNLLYILDATLFWLICLLPFLHSYLEAVASESCVDQLEWLVAILWQMHPLFTADSTQTT